MKTRDIKCPKCLTYQILGFNDKEQSEGGKEIICRKCRAMLLVPTSVMKGEIKCVHDYVPPNGLNKDEAEKINRIIAELKSEGPKGSKKLK